MDKNKLFFELQEYVVVGENLQTEPLNSNSQTNLKVADCKWSQNSTRLLIDTYAKYKEKLGTFEVKSTKMLWVKIADELLKSNIQVTPNNCLNRWRGLERNYKKHIDNQNKTGRGFKFFEYQSEMEEIFGKKRNVHPEMLLSNDQIDHLDKNINQNEISIQENTNIPSSSKEVSVTPLKELPVDLSSLKKIKRTTTPKTTQKNKKISTMEKMRVDRKMYFDEKLKIEREKLEQIKKRNRLIEERNILREKKCVCDCQLASFK